MVEEYLPKMEIDCRIGDHILVPPRGLIQRLKNGTALRNKIAHSPRLPPHMASWLQEDWIYELMLAVRDLLALLDYYSGQVWALRRIRKETMLAMKTEAEKQGLSFAQDVWPAVN